MQVQILGKDGTLSSVDPIVFDHSGNVEDFSTIPDQTLLKVNAPGVNADNQNYYIPKINNKNACDQFMYDPSSQSWVSGSPTITSTAGLRIVITPNLAQGRLNVYYVTNPQTYETIPNLSQHMRVETYVSEAITKDNFYRYRIWNVPVQGSFIPLTLHTLGVSNGSNFLCGVVLFLTTDNTIQLQANISMYSATVKPDYEKGRAPQISTRCYSTNEAPTPLEDLDNRVTSLENSMIDLESQVTLLTNQVVAAEERINKVMTKTSSIFVSR